MKPWIVARRGSGCRKPELVLFLLLAAACGRQRSGRVEETDLASVPDTGTPAAAPLDRSRPDAPPPTRAEMHNVDLRISEGAKLHVGHLIGEAVSLHPGDPVRLDEKESYEIRVESADATIGYEDLSRVMNEYTLAFDGAPVKAVHIAREEDEDELDEIELTGRLKKVLGVPFELEGRPEVTPDGRIRIRTTSIQALDVKVGGLMDALGLEPGDLMGNMEKRGLAVDGEDLILDASRALPPPRVTGRVTAVRVEPNGLALTLGTPAARRTADAEGRGNYLWFRKGTIRIGKMTQVDADLRIVDADPDDPFDFYADRMTQQLVAGYAKLGANGGLTMFVPDYEDRRRAPGASGPAAPRRP